MGRPLHSCYKKPGFLTSKGAGQYKLNPKSLLSQTVKSLKAGWSSDLQNDLNYLITKAKMLNLIIHAWILGLFIVHKSWKKLFWFFYSAPYFSVAKLRINSLTTVLYDRQRLCQTIGLSVNQLPLLACLLGNDVVSEEKMQHIRNNAMETYRYLGFYFGIYFVSISITFEYYFLSSSRHLCCRPCLKMLLLIMFSEDFWCHNEKQ